MYIIAIAWIYVVVLMATTEKNITAGALTFIFYGLLPCALLLWILGRNHRRHKLHQKSLEAEALSDENVHDTDSTNTKSDE